MKSASQAMLTIIPVRGSIHGFETHCSPSRPASLSLPPFSHVAGLQEKDRPWSLSTIDLHAAYRYPAVLSPLFSFQASILPPKPSRPCHRRQLTFLWKVTEKWSSKPRLRLPPTSLGSLDRSRSKTYCVFLFGPCSLQSVRPKEVTQQFIMISAH